MNDGSEKPQDALPDGLAQAEVLDVAVSRQMLAKLSLQIIEQERSVHFFLHQLLQSIQLEPTHTFTHENAIDSILDHVGVISADGWRISGALIAAVVARPTGIAEHAFQKTGGLGGKATKVTADGTENVLGCLGIGRHVGKGGI